MPVGLVVSAIPIYVTWRLLGASWRTWAIVRLLYILLAVSTILLAFTDPSRPTALFIPEWLGGLLGFYFVAAPLLLAGCVLFELHRVNLQA